LQVAAVCPLPRIWHNARQKPRRSFADDPTLMPRLFELLDICFPGISEQAIRISLKGSAWEDTSIPFLIEGPTGQPIAHVGLLSIPAIVCGQRQTIGALHAVCTHPAHRQRGLCRALIEEVIAFSERRYDALMLTTSKPAIVKR
jgi:predicted N-acetyltransferase YhbS